MFAIASSFDDFDLLCVFMKYEISPSWSQQPDLASCYLYEMLLAGHLKRILSQVVLMDKYIKYIYMFIF